MLFDLLELSDLLALLPLFDLLALLVLPHPPDLHVTAPEICLPLRRPVCVCPAIYMQELSYSLDKSKRWNSSERQRIRQAFRHYMLLRLNSMHITAMDRNPHKSGACLSCLHSPDSFDGT